MSGFSAMLAGPASVVIDGRRYTYASKSPSAAGFARGPYRFLAKYHKGIYDHGGHQYDPANWYDMGFFKWLDNTTFWQHYAGYVLSADSGFAIPIVYNDWQAPLEDTWDAGPTNRISIGDTSDFPLESLQTNMRMYMGPGLINIGRAYGESDISHGWGSLVYQWATEEYKCMHFAAFSAANEMTVKDIIDTISRTVGVYPTFSGDFVGDGADHHIHLAAGTPYQIY
jgi:hypothetical protein